MQYYFRVTNSLTDIGNLIPVQDNPYDYMDADSEGYLSVYQYTEEQKRLFEQVIKVTKDDGSTYQRKHGSVGIESVITNKLVFDTDDASNLENARKHIIEIANRLKSEGIDESKMKISFSGSKGFSLILHHNENWTPKEHKTIATELAGDLQTFDPKIYNASRIFRLDYTRHNTTGNYKTPLSLQQVKSLDITKILNLSTKQITPVNRIITVDLPPSFKLLKEKAKEATTKVNEVQYELDFSQKPYYLSDIKYILHKGYIPQGYGNEGMMVLCSTYKYVGFDKIDSFKMLQGVNEKRSAIYGTKGRTDDEIKKQVVDYVYSSAWKGGTYSPKENELLQKIATEFGIVEKENTVTITQVKSRFLDFARNVNKNVIKTGIKSLDKNILMSTGTLVGLLGAPSSGKTSISMSILENSSKAGINSLMLSLDMHDNLLYSRLLGQQSGVAISSKLRKLIETDELYDSTYKIEEDSELIEASTKVHEVYKNADFNFVRGCTIESIEEEIRKSKVKYGNNFKLVIVDYLEKVRGPYSDSTANSGFIASRLADLASKYDVLVLVLLQTQKSSGDPSQELTSMRKVKGASLIEQDSRIILTLHRPGFNPKDSSRDRYATIAVVKNNMGDVMTLDYAWNGVTGKLSELSYADQKSLAALREEKEAEKAEDDSW